MAVKITRNGVLYSAGVTVSVASILVALHFQGQVPAASKQELVPVTSHLTAALRSDTNKHLVRRVAAFEQVPVSDVLATPRQTAASTVQNLFLGVDTYYDNAQQITAGNALEKEFGPDGLTKANNTYNSYQTPGRIATSITLFTGPMVFWGGGTAFVAIKEAQRRGRISRAKAAASGDPALA